MKGSSILMTGIFILVIAFMGYYNFQQTQTIELLNEEILEQARLRHNLIFKKHTLEKQIEELKADTTKYNELEETQ